MYHQETLLFSSTAQSQYRIPGIITTKNGTVIAFCNDRGDTLSDHAADTALAYAVKRPGESFGPVQTLSRAAGWRCLFGSAVYDPATDTVFCSAIRDLARDEFGHFTDEEIHRLEALEAERAAAEGVRIGPILFRSTDGGVNWQETEHRILPRVFVTPDGRTISHGGSCHGSGSGIYLQHGAKQGRLLCPSRFMTGRYDNWDDAIRCCYNNSIYSDDHGQTWQASAPVQQGTGEGTLFEDGSGVIHYNSRGMYNDAVRWLATSTDGGDSYHDFRAADFLYEVRQIGCNASLLRVERDALPELPDGIDAVTIFVNPRAEGRYNMTACVSFDDGKSWTHTRCIWPEGCAYSSLAYDAVSRHFFLLYEKGSTKANPYELGVAVLEFDLAWLLR